MLWRLLPRWLKSLGSFTVSILVFWPEQAGTGGSRFVQNLRADGTMARFGPALAFLHIARGRLQIYRYYGFNSTGILNATL